MKMGAFLLYTKLAIFFNLRQDGELDQESVHKINSNSTTPPAKKKSITRTLVWLLSSFGSA
jgi:hypothetical protein